MKTYYVAGLPFSDELYHHGIKGQKWGVRRFQNLDRTLTEEGKKRYGSRSRIDRAANRFAKDSATLDDDLYNNVMKYNQARDKFFSAKNEYDEKHASKKVREWWRRLDNDPTLSPWLDTPEDVRAEYKKLDSDFRNSRQGKKLKREMEKPDMAWYSREQKNVRLMSNLTNNLIASNYGTNLKDIKERDAFWYTHYNKVLNIAEECFGKDYSKAKNDSNVKEFKQRIREYQF